MKEGNSEMDDTRIEGYDPLIPPQILQQVSFTIQFSFKKTNFKSFFCFNFQLG